MGAQRAAVWGGLVFLFGCASDVASERLFACRVDRDCRAGWYCVAQVCSADPAPDQGGGQGGDLGIAGAGGQDVGVAGAGGQDIDAGVAGAGGRDIDAGVAGAGGQDLDAGQEVDGAGGQGGEIIEDLDGDGLEDDEDNCPDVANPDQVDSDGDGDGDACVPCAGLNTPCALVLSAFCPDDRCGGGIERPTLGGVCNGTYCAFNTSASVLSPCGATQKCVEDGAEGRCEEVAACRAGVDRDMDGVPDDEDTCPDFPDPNQEDSDADGIGDHCAPCAPGSMCVVVLGGPDAPVCESDECGGTGIRTTRTGQCNDGRCGTWSDAAPQRIGCGPGSVCTDDDGSLNCVVDPACDDGCTLLNEGVSCGADFGFNSRCLGGDCVRWDCEEVRCNENGPNLGENFGPFEDGAIDPNVVVDARYDTLWTIQAAEVVTLTEAHRHCQETVRDELGGAFRLPTWYELVTVARKNANDHEAFSNVGWLVNPNDVYLTRTVPDVGEVVGVRLGTGEVVRVPSVAPDGVTYAVACVDASLDQAQNLAARQSDWDEDRPFFHQDPWTGLVWVFELFDPVMWGEAEMACFTNGFGQMATVEQVLSLLSFQVPDPPGPGFWPEWRAEFFARAQGEVWTRSEVDPNVQSRWVVNLGTGEIYQRSIFGMDRRMLFCVE